MSGPLATKDRRPADGAKPSFSGRMLNSGFSPSADIGPTIGGTQPYFGDRWRTGGLRIGRPVLS